MTARLCAVCALRMNANTDTICSRCRMGKAIYTPLPSGDPYVGGKVGP